MRFSRIFLVLAVSSISRVVAAPSKGIIKRQCVSSRSEDSTDAVPSPDSTDVRIYGSCQAPAQTCTFTFTEGNFVCTTYCYCTNGACSNTGNYCFSQTSDGSCWCI